MCSRFFLGLFSLLIFRVQKVDSGHYICGRACGEFFYGYDVDVQEVLQVLFPWNIKQRTRVQEAEPTSIKTEKFQVFTSYSLNVTTVMPRRTRCMEDFVTSKAFQTQWLPVVPQQFPNSLFFQVVAMEPNLW